MKKIKYNSEILDLIKINEDQMLFNYAENLIKLNEYSYKEMEQMYDNHNDLFCSIMEYEYKLPKIMKPEVFYHKSFSDVIIEHLWEETAEIKTYNNYQWESIYDVYDNEDNYIISVTIKIC